MKCMASDESTEKRPNSHEIPPSSQVRADSYDEAASEEMHKLCGTSEGCLTDPTASAFESSVKSITDDFVLIKSNEIDGNYSQSPPSAAKVLTKGSGLRKWRRIKRDLKKEGSGSMDSAQILKRRLPNTELSKNREENKLKSKVEVECEESVASVESRNAEIKNLPAGSRALDLELELLASYGFSIGIDSDNSEDHSSKSSTAASAPRPCHEALASGKERGRIKNFVGKGSTRLGIQRVQQDRSGIVDPSKKTRGDLTKFEKENSLSSVESDLRSSIAGIVQRHGAVDNNGKHNGRSSNFDEQSDEAYTGEEVRSGYYKANGMAENLSLEDLDAQLLVENNRKGGSCQSSSDLDSSYLQEAQEALKKEIQKTDSVRKELEDIDREFESIEAYWFMNHESQSVDLRSKAENLGALQRKTQSPKMLEGTDSELELLLKEKTQAEIEYFVLSRATENWKILLQDNISLFKEQRHLSEDQDQVMLRLKNVEEKAEKLCEQKDELETYCEELIGTENIQRLQYKVCKFSLCFFVQLMLFCIALGLFSMQLLFPAENEFVPT